MVSKLKKTSRIFALVMSSALFMIPPLAFSGGGDESSPREKKISSSQSQSKSQARRLSASQSQRQALPQLGPRSQPQSQPHAQAQVQSQVPPVVPPRPSFWKSLSDSVSSKMKLISESMGLSSKDQTKSLTNKNLLIQVSEAVTQNQAQSLRFYMLGLAENYEKSKALRSGKRVPTLEALAAQSRALDGVIEDQSKVIEFALEGDLDTSFSPELVQAYHVSLREKVPQSQSFTLVGRLYLLGFGVEKNYSTAAEYFKNAIQLGDTTAEYYLGLCYFFRDKTIKQNFQAGFQHFEKAVQAGDSSVLVQAEYMLGYCYFRGLGVVRDQLLGRRFFGKAYSKGNEALRKVIFSHYVKFQKVNLLLQQPSSVGSQNEGVGRGSEGSERGEEEESKDSLGISDRYPDPKEMVTLESLEIELQRRLSGT